MRPGGNIRLRVGDELKDPLTGYSQIKMTDGKIELLCGQVGKEAGIRITPYGVSLWNSLGCEIDIGDPVSVGPPSPDPTAMTKIKINGTFLDLTADIKTEIKTLVLSKQGQGVIKQQGGITTKQ